MQLNTIERAVICCYFRLMFGCHDETRPIRRNLKPSLASAERDAYRVGLISHFHLAGCTRGLRFLLSFMHTTATSRVIKPENARTKWNWDFFLERSFRSRKPTMLMSSRGENRTQINPRNIDTFSLPSCRATISVRISIKTTHASKSLSEIEFIIKLKSRNFLSTWKSFRGADWI